MKSTLAEWNEFIALRPEAHLLQTGAWGELKSAFDWKAERIIGNRSGVQILFRSVPGGFTVGYIPKGPVGDQLNELLPEIDQVCRENRAIFLKVEPDVWEDPNEIHDYKKEGFKHTKPIQPRQTIFINIAENEDLILAGMKQKTRYNIRLAEKKEIRIASSNDIEIFHQMMMITGKRDGINAHSQAYFQKAYDLFRSSGNCELLFAYFQDEPVAALMVFAQGKMAWYMYGASTEIERNRMPTYLLQWEAIRWAKTKGCEFYDLWGIPDVDEAVLEETFLQKMSHEGLWGVYRFKRGFGGKVMRSSGAWDRIYFPTLYKLYTQVMKLRGSQGE
jgi:peptidoglycan pentaglycine glycine transferase (the first glycine)